jgi:hypothetical protein
MKIIKDNRGGVRRAGLSGEDGETSGVEREEWCGKGVKRNE